VANCGLLWEWRSQLEKIKLEFDQVLLNVIEGLESFRVLKFLSPCMVLSAFCSSPSSQKIVLKVWSAKGPIQFLMPTLKSALKLRPRPGCVEVGPRPGSFRCPAPVCQAPFSGCLLRWLYP
jgi:hypothetical protein